MRQVGVDWSCLDVRTRGLRGFLRQAAIETSSFQPDWVVGVSDAWYGWLAHNLSRRFAAHLGIDAYDNFEAYMPWNKPLHWRWRRALQSAELVTAAGPQLANLLKQYRGGKPVSILPMAADPTFTPMGRDDCREKLGLPLNVPLIGYSGGWARNRGTHILQDVFLRVRNALPDAKLVVTGQPPQEIGQMQGVIATGYLNDEFMPLLVNALDVACIVTADTAFGRYSYPAKLYEAMACQVPVVATATQPVRWILQGKQRHLARVGDADSIAAQIINNIAANSICYGRQKTWGDVGARFAELLRQC